MKLPPIYAINRDRDVKRWQRLKQMTKRAGLSDEVQRFSAISGKDISIEELKKRSTWIGRQLQPLGVLGCAMSHISLWEKMVAEDIPMAIIFEDDVELVDNFRERLEESLQKLIQTYPSLGVSPVSQPFSSSASLTPSAAESFECAKKTLHHTPAVIPVDVILLGGLGRVHPQGKDSVASRLFSWYFGGRQTLCQAQSISVQQRNSGVYIPRRPAGTHAYLVTQQGARSLLKACPKARYHIDIDAWGQRTVNVGMFDPMLAYQSFGASTLTDRENSLSTFRCLARGEVGCLIPQSWIDPFTRQPWAHALSEPLLQFTNSGPMIRSDQLLSVCSAAVIGAGVSHGMRWYALRRGLVGVAVGLFVLVKLLITLLLNSK